MSDKKTFLNDLDSALSELDFGVSNLSLVHSAMVEGTAADSTLEESLYCVQLYMENRCKLLRELLQSALEARVAI